jgi:hypothetical protein
MDSLTQGRYYPTHIGQKSTLQLVTGQIADPSTHDPAVRSLALIIAFLIGAVSGLYIQFPELPEGALIDSKVEIRRRVD